MVQVISLSGFATVNLEFAEQRRPEDRPKAGVEAAAGIDAFLRRAGSDGKEVRKGFFAEQSLFRENREALSALIRDSQRPLFYGEAPVRFALRGEELTLILTTIVSDQSYNTLSTDARQRGSSEIEHTVLPCLRRLHWIDFPSVKNFGIVAVYSTRDFSQKDSILTRKGEVVALVAPRDKCEKLSAAEITEDEFVRRADVYLIERRSTDVRKVELSLRRE